MKSNTISKQHPVKILAYTTKNFWLLSIPLIRGLVSLRFDFRTWLRGAWVDILVVVIMLAFATFRWFFIEFEIGNSFLMVYRGFFFKRLEKISFSKIASISIEKKLVLIPFSASNVFIDTNCGSHKKSDFKLTFKQKDVDNLSSTLKEYNKDASIKYSYHPQKRHLVFFSLIFSNTLSGVILISTLFYQGGKIVGKELEEQFLKTFNQLTEKIAFGLPPAAVTVSFIILGGWVLSFILNFLRYWSFSAERQGKNITVRNGFITKRSYFINGDKINFTDFRQSLLTVIFKISSSYNFV